MLNSLSEEAFRDVDENIKRIGVFVNASVQYITDCVEQFDLDGIQLHGDESVEEVKSLKSKVLSKKDMIFIKAFGVGEYFDFTQLEKYKNEVDFFLFDTKSKNYGGTGRQFDWTLLKDYDNEKPIWLSGGVDVKDIEEIITLNLNIDTIDMNSKLEDKPGKKNLDKVTEAIYTLQGINNRK